MPNKIGVNVRQILLSAITTRLETIRIANGYNTQPRVCRDWMAAQKAPETFSLWAQTGVEESGVIGMQGRHTNAIDIHISGFIRKTGDVDLQVETNKLLQDVRNCLAAYGETFRTLVGTGGFVEFGTCETDEGALLEAGRAFFDQTATFQYNAGNDW